MARKRFEDARLVLVGEMPVCDPSKIPAYVAKDIGRTIYDAVSLAFQQPGVQEDYLRWKAAMEAKGAAV